MGTTAKFNTWWLALAPVPQSTKELDWWAPSDGRHSRYERLLRVFGDSSDPMPFYCLDKEKHLVPVLWENFSLFSPAHTVHALYAALGFEIATPATDVCWSWEFNLGHRDRQLDLVIHVRFASHDEIILSEGKAPDKPFASKDFDAEAVLHRSQFQVPGVTRWRYFLLGDGEVKPAWMTSDRGVLRWERLLNLQLGLCDTLGRETPEVRQLIRTMISAQFRAHGFGGGPQPSVALERFA